MSLKLQLYQSSNQNHHFSHRLFHSNSFTNFPLFSSAYIMVNYIAKGEERNNSSENFEWGFTGSVSNNNVDDAAKFYQRAANSFKFSKSWDQAGSTYIKLAECYLKWNSDHEAAAAAYVEAAGCYKKILPIQAISCLEQAVNHFCSSGKFGMAARYCKEAGELHEQLRDFEKGVKYVERAAELFASEESTTLASQCKQKVAQFSAQLKQYTKAIEMFEEVAWEAVNSNLLRYGVRGHLLNAGICHLCKGDLVVTANALERYQVLDQKFSGTREYELLIDLVTAYKEKDVEKFTEVLKDYDSLSPLDSWKIILLLRVKEDLKTKAQKYKM